MAVGEQSRKIRPRALAIISVLALACAWTTLTASTADATGGIGSVWSVPGSPYQPGAPVVALTFDDGPNPTYTPQVLGILAQYHVPATFFVLGREAVVYPELLQAEKAAGHSVENHTWDHVNLPTTPLSAWPHQVDDVSTVIQGTTGSAPTCLRPPGGGVNDAVVNQVAARGMATVGWSVDPADWSEPGALAIAYRVLSNVRAGSIILMHDGGGNRSQTVAALPTIIEGLQARGLTPVSLCDSGPPPPPPPPRLVNGQWFLRSSPSSGVANIAFNFGDPGDLPITGDWNGDGVDTPGVIRGDTFFLRNSNSTGVANVAFTYGDPGDRYIVGDWNGDGTDTIGVVRGSTFFLRNSNTSGPADVVFNYGDAGDRVIVGHWSSATPADTIGIVRGDTFFLRNANTTGVANIVFSYGVPNEPVAVGDWNGDGIDTPAVIRFGTYLARNSNTSGAADVAFSYGDPGDKFRFVGRWVGGAGPQGPGVAR